MGTARTTAELEAARLARVPVRLRRTDDLAALEGYVQGIGDRWLLLARLTDGLWLRGWTAVRLADLRAPQRTDDAGFVQDALRLRGHWPPPTPDVAPDLSTTAALLGSVQDRVPLVAVHREGHGRPTCVRGAVRRVGERRVHVQPVTPAARWTADTTAVRLAEVTRVDFGGGYEAALLAVAGPAPR